jgi:hypothetical protein
VSLVVTPFLIALIVPVMMRWRLRGALEERADPLQGGILMKPTLRQRKFAISLALMGSAVGLIIFLIEYPLWQRGLILCSLFLLITWPYLLTLRRRVVVTEEGLLEVKILGRSRKVTWSAIRSISFRKSTQVLRLKVQGGGTIVIPVYMSGLWDLEGRCSSHLSIGVRGDAFQKLWTYLAAL